MRKLLAIAVAALLTLGLALPIQPALAAQNRLSLMTGPLDPSNLLSYFNTLINSINTTFNPAPCVAAGATPVTCAGNAGIATTTSLSTAHGANASYVITNTSVNATSVITCTIDAYSGTIGTNGAPVITQCVPTAGTITVNIHNSDEANALSGTVGIGFRVFN